MAQLPGKEESLWASFAAFGLIAVIGVSLYIYFVRWRIKNREFLSVSPQSQPLAPVLPAVAPGDEPVFILSEPTAFDQYVVILLSLVIIVIIMVSIALAFSPSKSEEEPILVSFPEVMVRKREYRFDGDPRDVVINAYGASLESLRKKGMKVPVDSTPWEFQKQVGSPHLRKLTQLFEKARYSVHNITLQDSQEALRQLKSIEAEKIIPPHRFMPFSTEKS